MMASFRILRPDDARELAMIHASVFDTPWSAAALRTELKKPPVLGLAFIDPAEENRILSFVLFQRALDEAEMLTLATLPTHQKRGYAKTLLKAAFSSLRERGVAKCLLDVAADNQGAISLYQKLGFTEDGRRKGYYKRSGAMPADAILMSSDLTGLSR